MTSFNLLEGPDLISGDTVFFSAGILLTGLHIPAMDAALPASPLDLQLYLSHHDAVLTEDDVILGYHVSSVVGSALSKGLNDGEEITLSETESGKQH